MKEDENVKKEMDVDDELLHQLQIIERIMKVRMDLTAIALQYAILWPTSTRVDVLNLKRWSTMQLTDIRLTLNRRK